MSDEAPTLDELTARFLATRPTREERERARSERLALALEHPPFREVHDLRAGALERFATLARENEGSVVRWRSASWTLLAFDPYHGERNRYPRPIIWHGVRPMRG